MVPGQRPDGRIGSPEATAEGSTSVNKPKITVGGGHHVRKVAAFPLWPARIFVILGLAFLALSASVPSAGAQITAPDTTYTSVVVLSTSSGYTPLNTNINWTNSNSCGSFSGSGAGAVWEYGPGVGATPCTSSLPSGTITETIMYQGTVLATCTETDGAVTWGSQAVTPNDQSAPGCTSAGTGVTINLFYAQAYNAAGDPISAPSGNDYWIIAVVVIVIILLVLFFLWWRRRKATAPTAQAQTAVPGATPAPVSAVGTSYCGHCGHVLDPGAKFCRSCGAPVT